MFSDKNALSNSCSILHISKAKVNTSIMVIIIELVFSVPVCLLSYLHQRPGHLRSRSLYYFFFRNTIPTSTCIIAGGGKGDYRTLQLHTILLMFIVLCS